MRQRPHRNWSVVGRHAAKFRARHQHGARAQIRAAESREHAGRSGANDDDVSHLVYSRRYSAILKPILSGMTVPGPTGSISGFAAPSLTKAISFFQTVLKNSLTNAT